LQEGVLGKGGCELHLPIRNKIQAYGIGKHRVKRLNIKGIERIEKTKLARIN
jgi:hypothetical protein